MFVAIQLIIQMYA